MIIWAAAFSALTALVLSLICITDADGAYAEAYGYGGARWQGTTVCVHNKADSPLIRDAVYRAVKLIRDQTDMHVINMGKTTCKGYSQVVNVVDNYYATSNVGLTTYPNGMRWGYTPNQRLATYLYNSGVEVQFNTRFTSQFRDDWPHIAIHELSHAILGLGHRSDTCYSVVSSKSLKECNWKRPTILQSVDLRLARTIYGW